MCIRDRKRVAFGYIAAKEDILGRAYHQDGIIGGDVYKRQLSNYYKYLSRPKRCAVTVSLDELIGDQDGMRWDVRASLLIKSSEFDSKK